MLKETLRQNLHNKPLIATLSQKIEIDSTKKKLLEVLQTLRDFEMSESSISEVESKYEEYNNISKAYGNMLEDVWGISWQNEEIIKRHIDFTDDEIDRLPDEIKNIY